MWWDTWIVDGAGALHRLLRARCSSYPVCILQTGRVQTYALFVVAGVLVMFGYYVVR